MQALPLNGDCLAMWRADEASASSNLVEVVNGYNLTQVDSPAVVTPGVVGAHARRFVATKRAYCSSGAYPLLRPSSGSITVAAIIRPLSGYSHPLPRCLMLVPRNWSSYYLPGYGICSKTANKTDFRFSIKTTGSVNYYHAGGTDELAVDLWHLVVGVFNSAAMTLSWYVDGALQEQVSTAPYDTIDFATGGSPAPLYVGANPYFIVAGIGYWAYCDIDEMAIYSSAKGLAWVQNVYSGMGQGPQLVSLVLEHAPDNRMHRLNIERRLLDVTGSAAAGQGPQLAALILEHTPDDDMHRLGATRRKN